jgi:hypothetical protein
MRRFGQGNHVQPMVICRITLEVGLGVYETEEVRWFDDGVNPADWQVVTDGRELTVQEINLTAGISVGTVIFAEQKGIHTPPSSLHNTDSFWVFQIGGGAKVYPAEIVSKVTSNGNGNEYLIDVWLEGRFQDDGTAITPAPLLGATCFIWQVSSDYEVPTGTWLAVIAVADHYEGQIPVWLC